MVNFINMDKVYLNSLKDKSDVLEGKYIYIKFKDKKGFYQDYSIIDKDSDISMFEDILYVFVDNELRGRIQLEDIDFILSYGGVSDE